MLSFWFLIDVGRGRFFTAFCRFLLYQSGCEAECVCLCLCVPVSFGSGLGGVCSVHLKRCKRGRMCLATVQVGFDCLAEATWAIFCVWGRVCSLSWHSWSSVSVCMN